MLGVSQPSNPPSSLRHSASFSCLQRSSNGETGHRARTSTLPQQPNVQLSSSTSHHHHHYGGPSSLQQNPSSLGSSSSRRLDGNGDSQQNPSENSNDYGFVRIRPRLRSTNSTVLREETDNRSWQQKSSYSDRDNSSSCFGALETSARSKQDSGSCDLEVSAHKSRESRDISKNSQQSSNPHQNPLRGALILFTTSTSSWWKAKQREELGTSSITSSSSSSGTTERKWSNGGSAMTPPSSTNGVGNDRKWISHHHKAQPQQQQQQQQQHGIGNPVGGSSLSERKWSSKTGTVVSSAGNNGTTSNNSKEDKWTSISASSASPSSTGQDRKWRSLGALLRTPVSSSGTAGAGGSQQHSSGRTTEGGSASFAQNMSVSMIENGNGGASGESSRECSTVGPPWKSLKYPATGQPTSYSAGRPSWSEKESLWESGEFARPVRSGKVSRRLYQESANESPECRVETWEDRRGSKTRGESSGDETGWKKKSGSNGRDCCQRSDRQNGGLREISTRSSRAQSFYLLDDFLRPWQQPQSSSKCSLDLCMPSQYPRNGGSSNDRSARSIELASSNGSAKSSQQQTSSSSSSSGCNVQQPRNNLTNITPPRRHNSSSDSLEVASSPLPPPVPPPPPPETGKREKDRGASGDQRNSFRDKDNAGSNASATAAASTTNNAGSNNATSAPSCHCRMCWASLQQRSFRDEIPM